MNEHQANSITMELLVVGVSLTQDVKPGESTHVEFTPTNIFSLVASLTPFCDFNQSPRNDVI